MPKTMKDILEEEKVKPLTNVNGTPLVSYQEQRDAAVEGIKERVDFGVPTLNPDGTVAKSSYHTAAINRDIFFDNRYRVVDGELQIVTAQTPDGYRAIKDQANGRCFTKLIPAHALKREGNKLKLVKNIQVSDTDFVSYFTHILDEDAMQEVLLAIQEGAQSTPKEKLPI